MRHYAAIDLAIVHVIVENAIQNHIDQKSLIFTAVALSRCKKRIRSQAPYRWANRTR